MAAQIEDGIADDLAGAMERDVAAAVALEEFDAALGEEFGGCDYVRSFGVAAQRDYWLVFEQKQDIADFLFFAQSDELLLQAKACGVVDGAELEDGDQSLFATDLRGFTRIKIKSFHHSGHGGNAWVLRAKNALRMTARFFIS